MTSVTDPRVAEAFDAAPPAIRKKMLALRKMILETAAAEDVGPLEETLKWGEPAYLTRESKAGTTIRLGWKPARPDRYALHVHCQTDLVETFRARFDDALNFEGNRAVVFDTDATPPAAPVKAFIAAALTYHRNRAKAARRRAGTSARAREENR